MKHLLQRCGIHPRRVAQRFSRRLNTLGNRRECPLCNWTGFRFFPFGIGRVRRNDALCPDCGSLERHRLAYVLLKSQLSSHQRTTLHVAPEPVIERWLRQISADYLSIDVAATAMEQMDITALPLHDNSFTLIYCSHVLEHVLDDAVAISELYRVLRPGGVAVIQVPIRGERTHEDRAVTTAEARLKEFLQRDHVRVYGRDIVKRLQQAGFDVEIRTVNEIDDQVVNRQRLAFALTNEVFVAQKEAS